MSAVGKTVLKVKHSGQGQPAKQRTKVTLNSRNLMTLGLSATAGQAILCLLTTEYNRLCQQVDDLTRKSKQLLYETPIRVPRQKFSYCVRRGKQSVYKYKGRSEIVYRECQRSDKDSVSCSNPIRLQEM